MKRGEGTTKIHSPLPPLPPLPSSLPSFSQQGCLPFDIYDKVLEVYGDDAAKLIINCDASFLLDTAPPPTQRTRTVPLLDSLQPLLEAITLVCFFLLNKNSLVSFSSHPYFRSCVC